MNSNLFSKRRGVLAISIDILKEANSGAGKTHLLYSVGLSYDQLKRYLQFLTNQGFIKEVEDSYQTTQKGHQLINEFDSSPLTQSILAV
jgi:predicted transcriptional regulator